MLANIESNCVMEYTQVPERNFPCRTLSPFQNISTLMNALIKIDYHPTLPRFFTIGLI